MPEIYDSYPILFAEQLPEQAEAVFRSSFASMSVLPSAELLSSDPKKYSEGQKAVIVTVNTKVDRRFIESLSDSVELIGLYSVGYNHVDLQAARLRGISVLNTPDVLTDAVADLALLLILGTARRAVEGIDLLRSGNWQGWSPTLLVGSELRGKTLAIFGMGRIGGEIARRAAALGMHVCYRNRQRLPEEQEGDAVFIDDERRFLEAGNFLLLAAPSNPATRNFLNAERISLLQKGAVVINIARGDLVDDDALMDALNQGHVGAAGLDVFNGEPLLDSRYKMLPNVFSLPHMGSSTIEARIAMAKILVDGIRETLDGKIASNRVDI